MASIPGPVACFDGVVWFEPRVEPNAPLDESNHNTTCPQVGEERHVCIRHEHQEPIAGKMWLLFQSAMSLANGFPEPEEELENAVIVEVEILSQEPLPKKKKHGYHWSETKYNAYVRCLQVVPLAEIPQTFAPCESSWLPEPNREVQIFETPSFLFVWCITQASTEWLLLTKAELPRLVLTCYSIELENTPFSVCNCEWDWTKWPHKVYKSRH